MESSYMSSSGLLYDDNANPYGKVVMHQSEHAIQSSTLDL